MDNSLDLGYKRFWLSSIYLSIYHLFIIIYLPFYTIYLIYYLSLIYHLSILELLLFLMKILLSLSEVLKFAFIEWSSHRKYLKKQSGCLPINRYSQQYSVGYLSQKIHFLKIYSTEVLSINIFDNKNTLPCTLWLLWV